MLKKYFLIFLSFFIGVSLADSKESTEDISRDYLIKKLEHIYRTTNSHDFSKKPMALRLAHILSLRAEDRLSQKYHKICKNCLVLGTRDARRSLSLYRQIGVTIKSKHPILYSHSLFQMAYLHSLMEEDSRSVTYLKQIIKLNVKDSFVVKSYFNLGEIYFKSYRYSLALKAFSEVLKRGKTPWEFRSHYRKIWSLYNLFSYNKSVDFLEAFLKSDLYKKGVRTEIEDSLKKKLQQELIVLYSRSELTDKRLQFLYHFDKDDKQANTIEARNQRLFDLAKDLNRIGRGKFSNKVWNVYLGKNPSLFNQIRAYVSIVDNHFVIHDKGWILRTGQVIEKLFALQKTIDNCPKEICASLYKQQKRYVKELHRRSEKDKKLKPYLLSLYKTYNTFYPNEFDMLVKSAFLSKELKKYELSQDLFQKSAKALHIKMKQSSDVKAIKNIKKDLEQVNIFQMEVAELSKSKTRRYQSYDFYLKNGSNEKIIYQSKYQKAYLIYEDKKYKQAANLFKDLALLKIEKPDKKMQALALKSAHLALSSLNFLEDKDVLMAEWSNLFYKKFPLNKEFIRIHYTAVFNMVKNLLSNQDFSSYPLKPSSDRNVLKAWKILNSVNRSYLNKEEKLKYYMNKLLLAKELLKLKEMDEIISQMMNMKSLSKEDYKVVLTWKLWLAEIRFDFKETLKLVKMLKPKETSEGHYLRLSYLAELANKDYISYYEKYIERYPTSDKSFGIVRHIIDKASKKDKKRFLKKYASYFAKKPDDLSYMVLKLDNQALDVFFIKSFADLSFMKDSSISKFLKRKSFIESFNESYQKVRSFSLSVKHLTRSIKTYKGLISQLEKQAELSVEMKDWPSQFVAFSRVYDELVRFYESILKLPMPENLTLEEQRQYTKLLEDQIMSYKVRAVKLKEEIDKLLAQNYIDKYIEVAKNHKVFHGLLKWEIDQLSPLIKDENQKAKISTLLNLIKFSSQKSSPIMLSPNNKTKDIYTGLRSNPFNKVYLKNLLKMGKFKKDDVMSYYLMNRIERINKSRKGRVEL